MPLDYLGMPTNFGRPFGGIEIVADRFLCNIKRKQRRTHRKARINRKWAKKYGFDSWCVNDACYNVMGTIISCPCIVGKLEKAIPAI